MKKNNAVALQGILKSVRSIDNINSMPYSGHEAIVETLRLSDVPDEAVVIAPDYMHVDNIGVNKPVKIVGVMQTFKNFITGKVLVYVLATEIREIEVGHWEYENEVFIRGKLGKGSTYRETPSGKRITDIFVNVDNVVKEGSCHIPCICWQRTADMVKNWEEGQKVVFKGRLQSRQYIKRLDETEEERIAYEVSINVIERE